MTGGRSEDQSRTGRQPCPRLAALAVLFVVAVVGWWAPAAQAVPTEGAPVEDHALKCLEGVTGTLSRTPQTPIGLGGSVTVSWSVTIPSGCTGFHFYLEGRYSMAGLGLADAHVVGRTGSLVVQPIADMKYSLRASANYGGKTFGPAVIQVLLPPDPQHPGRFLVSINANHLVPLLLQALATPNTTIGVANHVALDLSHRDNIEVREGVLLYGGRAGLAPGPRLYTTTRPQPLFRISGDSVRITGLRIEGPDVGAPVPADVGTGTGITVAGAIDVDIDNNEISGWNQAAIRVEDGDGTCVDDQGNTLADGRMCPSEQPYGGVRIRDNYIHHNQHVGEDGYGVNVRPGAYPLIERNVFDWNRHAIAASGQPGTGYAAYRNLVLEHGGYHDTYSACDPQFAAVLLAVGGPVGAAAVALECLTGVGPEVKTYTHQFDMHGTDECLLAELPWTGNQLNCGGAGHSMHIRHNTFLYKATTTFAGVPVPLLVAPAIKLRGNPEVGMYVGENVFAHDSIFEAVAQTETGLYIDFPYTDQVGVDDITELVHPVPCDFDGDGTGDAFMATGATWWYSSGGQAAWRYLNTSTKRLSELSLGHFNGDSRCDVIADGVLFPGGRPPLRNLNVDFTATGTGGGGTPGGLTPGFISLGDIYTGGGPGGGLTAQ